jgi:hypothetical protein
MKFPTTRGRMVRKRYSESILPSLFILWRSRAGIVTAPWGCSYLNLYELPDILFYILRDD